MASIDMISPFDAFCTLSEEAFAVFSVTESYRTVHKIFRTNLLHILSDSDII